MLKSELLELIHQGEGAKLEFKRDELRPETIAREIVAFANMNGGKILIGIEDDGTITGIQRDSLQAWLMDTVVSKYVNPPILPDYDEMMLDDKKIVFITVPRGAAKPYALRHNNREDFYMRWGNTCQPAKRKEMLRLFQAGGHLSVERMAINGCRVSELDENRAKPYLAKIYDYDDDTWASDKEKILRNHDFIKTEDNSTNTYLTYFACLLFAKNPRRYLPQAGIRLLVYPDNKREENERDVKVDEVMNLPFFGIGMDEKTDLISQAIEILKPHISREHLDVAVSPQRQTIWDYPLLVLRELIINAFAHRDWTKQNQIEITVYADCMEVMSPGALPNGMTVEKVIAGERTPRNNKILDILRDCGFVENRGMGIRRRVIPEMMRENQSEPIFEATEDYFRVILPRKPA